jgi:hypothetical protein
MGGWFGGSAVCVVAEEEAAGLGGDVGGSPDALVDRKAARPKPPARATARSEMLMWLVISTRTSRNRTEGALRDDCVATHVLRQALAAARTPSSEIAWHEVGLVMCSGPLPIDS